MSKINLFDICQEIKEKVTANAFIEKSKKIVTAFTRKRKMPFCDIIYFITSTTKQNLQTALDDYFTKKGDESVNISRQGFSKARENIKHEAFIELNDTIIKRFETDDTEIATYRGYRLFSADGTLIDLPNTEKLREYFGYSSNSSHKVFAKALGITVFDVLNKLTIFAELYRYDDSEKRRIVDIVDGFAQLNYPKSIWLLDRGYPSFALFNKLQNNGQNFVIRVSSQSLKEINEANKVDQTLMIIREKVTLKLRVVNIVLPNGNSEKLVTNLSEEFTVNELQELYNKRWGIETNYRLLKRKMFVEVFTGESVTAVLQDFHASILILNMAAISEREQEDILQKGDENKDLKHTYHPNKSKLISDIKKDFVKLILSDNPLDKVFRQFLIYFRIRKFAYKSAQDRHFPRDFVHSHNHRSTHPKLP